MHQQIFHIVTLATLTIAPSQTLLPKIVPIIDAPVIQQLRQLEPVQALPELKAVEIAEVPLQAVEEPVLQPQAVYRPSVGNTAGNLYEAGQCVWHVKNLKPELPNSLGSAYQWIGNARAMGWPMGTEPRVGAAGVKGNHAVYVVAVNGDGTILISEMNYDYVPYHQRTIIKPAHDYTYLY